MKVEWDKNYASNDKIKSRAKKLLECINETRRNRIQKESEWRDDYNLYSCKLDANQMYQGRANIFIPEMRKQIDTTASKHTAVSLPDTDSWFHVLSSDPQSPIEDQNLPRIRAAVKRELTITNNIYDVSTRYNLQKVLYGTSPIKIHFKSKMKDMFYKDRNGKTKQDKVPLVHGVKLEVKDLLKWYVYPETASTLDEVEVVFEDSLVLKREAEDLKRYYKIENVPAMNFYSLEQGYSDLYRLQTMGITKSDQFTDDRIYLTEVWADFDINEGEFVPCLLTFANQQECVEIRRNPLWFQKPPYVVGRYAKMPAKEFYGRSLSELVRSLQYQINDIGNQTMDSLTYTLNPIVVIDPGLAGDVNSFKIEPGAKWLGSPAGIKFQTFQDVSSIGYQGMQEIRSIIGQVSENSPGIAPQLTGKVRTATHAGAVEREVQSAMSVDAYNDEADVYNPMCKMIHILLQQYMEKDYVVRVHGPDIGQYTNMMVKPSDLAGDADFIWKGLSEEQASNIKSQQLLNMYNLAIQASQFMPNEIDLKKLFQIVVKKAFNFDQLEDIFVSVRDQKTVDPDIENIALKQGQDVKTNNGDDDEKHIKSHVAILEDKKLKPEDKLNIIKHIEIHQAQMQAKDYEKQQKVQMEALKGQMQMLDSNSGQSGVNGMVGNKSQFANPKSESDLMRGMGV